VLVTVGNMPLDEIHYQVNFPTSNWLAAVLAVVLLAYLLIDVRGSDSV
jgi:hypothetical protein